MSFSVSEVAMPSPSTSSRRRTYQVFLSFRGKDTRKKIVSHLYENLQNRNQIETFIDEEGIDRGSYIDDTLFQKIQEAVIAVIVLSKNYSDSHWCLDELVEIMNCHRKNGLVVYTVYYDVKPSDVSNLRGDFGDAFSKHTDAEKVDLWRRTLKNIKRLRGWDLTDPSASHEAGCINEIVEKINRELDKVNLSIDENCARNVVITGILGMPGSGKTTAARKVFDDICADFDGCSFVDKIGEVSKSRGLVFLQKKILSDVLGHEVQVSDENDGCRKIKQRLCRKKVLIVLDNVDSEEQLEALVGNRSWFGDGSKVIITTTDERLLVAHKLVDATHNVILLNDEEAIQLFNHFAFKNCIPTGAHMESVERVIRYAAGHPGALKRLGSMLINRPVGEWPFIIDSLATCPEGRIDKTLKLSLEGLEPKEMELFLDIACFFSGWLKDEVTDILDGCGLFATRGLPILKEKCFITFAGEFIQMHNLYMETGRNIVRQEDPDEPGRQSRLWRPEDVGDVLTENKGTEHTKAIVISKPNRLDAETACDTFTSMRRLRLLHASTRRAVVLVHGSNGSSEGEWIMEGSGSLKYLPCDLKWLTWDYFNLESLPIDFRAKQLVGLQMRHSSIRDLCIGRDMKFLGKLSFLDLSFSEDLISTPNFENLPHLKKTEP